MASEQASSSTGSTNAGWQPGARRKAVLGSWSGPLHALLSRDGACPRHLHARICKRCTSVFPKAACTSGLRWAEQDGERAIAEAFLFLGTFCPFHNPHCGPGLAPRALQATPAARPTFVRKARPVLPLGTAAEHRCLRGALTCSLAGATAAVPISPGQSWSRQFRVSLLSEF